ncbi:phosphotransferase enzyme family protein [Actinopolymorpha pittospori]|uniref:Homoserine kinase type II n=1 Tax=Actinopolymorpha pittospori TaxID=648752 RepID=A0A927MV42_9ACTN|nr:phosphotransferase [Actinopolymorpha pittospori]MBE1607445.1 homoserine kinase type II [Actinopolymorpha pittospori]
MNDVQGGDRGTRPVPTSELIDVLRVGYGLGVRKVADLGGVNLNVLVDAEDGRYVARAYLRYVTPDRLTAIQDVRRSLTAAGVPCPRHLPTRDGAGWTILGESLVEVERFVDHDGYMKTSERLRQGLPLLGRLHSVTRTLEVSAAGRASRYANHIQPEDALAATTRATTRIRGWAPTPAERGVADLADELAALVSAGERDLWPKLPRQLVHGDFWDNNVFFRGDQVVMVADFDFMGERARVDDLALTLYFADLAPPLLDIDARAGNLRALVDAYETGLDAPLTAAERAALPWALARQPLWEIGGWIGTLAEEEKAREYVAEMPTALGRALQIARRPDLWSAVFE